MPDRTAERTHIRQFLQAELGPVPDEKLRFNDDSNSDAPDCLLRLDEGPIGIEHTQFFFPPDLPGQPSDKKLDTLQREAVEEAGRLFRGPPLYVFVTFDDRQMPKTDREARILAEKLAELVAQNGWTPHSFTRFETRSDFPGVRSYLVMASRDGEKERWSGGRGGVVETVEPDHIQVSLARKASRYSHYVRHAPTVWLLIVNDWVPDGRPCELGDEARAATYVTAFDRIYWLETVAGTVVTKLRRE